MECKEHLTARTVFSYTSILQLPHRHSLEPLEAAYVLLENSKSLPKILFLVFFKLQIKEKTKRCYIGFNLHYPKMSKFITRKVSMMYFKKKWLTPVHSLPLGKQKVEGPPRKKGGA